MPKFIESESPSQMPYAPMSKGRVAPGAIGTRPDACRTEIDKMQKQRVQRRIKMERARADRVAEEERNIANGNPGDVDFMGMIKAFRNERAGSALPHMVTTFGTDICVAIRKRPTNSKERASKDHDAVSCFNPEVTIHECKLRVDGITKVLDNVGFRFDHTFGEEADNQRVYDCTAEPLVPFVLNSGRATVFAYGQTGSGKTYTMAGIQKRAIKDLFNRLARMPGGAYLSVGVSFFEIYGGHCQDLLNHRNRVVVREDGNGEVVIAGLKEKKAIDAKRLEKLIADGNRNRTTHATGSNDQSSRSHAICQIYVRDTSSGRLHGKLSLIDLAGSERGADSKSHNRQRRVEGADINKSLLALKECIRALDSKSVHVPYRASKLTLVLKDTFTRRGSRMVMIATVSPGASSADHTINTLRYADRVKENKVEKFRPGVNGGSPAVAPRAAVEAGGHALAPHPPSPPSRNPDASAAAPVEERVAPSAAGACNAGLREEYLTSIRRKQFDLRRRGGSPAVAPRAAGVAGGHASHQGRPAQHGGSPAVAPPAAVEAGGHASLQGRPGNNGGSPAVAPPAAVEAGGHASLQAMAPHPPSVGDLNELNRAKAEIAELTRERDALRIEMSKLEVKIVDGEVQRRLMHNTIQELRGNIRVCARIRPFLSGDNVSDDVDPIVVTEKDGTGCTLSKHDVDGGNLTESFSLDKCFPPSAGQEEVFGEVSDLVQSALDGYKVCIFNYGQTGSGKSHTMQGSGAGSMRGIIPRAMEQVGKYKTKLEGQGWKYEITVSSFEIYDDKIRDLLRDDSSGQDKKHEIKRDDHGNTDVSNLTTETIDPNDSAMVDGIMQRATCRRAIAGTAMNENSSRSHSVFTLYLKATNDSQRSELEGTLHLVDLAGSERLGRSHSKGDRLKETVAINKSLSALTGVFAAISNNSSYIPFQNSKLTRLLRPALSGDGKTLMMVNLSPTEESYHESLCSLRFAKQVKKCERKRPHKHVRIMTPSETPSARGVASSSRAKPGRPKKNGVL